MEEADIPLTLDNFLAAEFLGNVPPLEEIDEEVLQEMPEWFAVQIRQRQEEIRHGKISQHE